MAKSPVKRTTPSRTAKNQPIELSSSSDDDDGPTVATSRSNGAQKTNGQKPVSRSKASATPVKKPSNSTAQNGNKRKAVPESDEDSEEDVKPFKKRASMGGSSKPVTATRKKNNKIADSEDDDEDDYKDEGAQDDDDDDDLDDAVDDDDGDFDEDDDEEDEKPKAKSKAKAPAKKAAPAAAKKSAPPPPKKATPAPAASSKASSSKTQLDEEEEEVKPKPKPKWIPKGPSAPPNPGSKEIPEGAPDALGGLTIVFTGELESIGREEATTLAKRYGAKVTTSVSSKTSYVVLGSEAGFRKLEMIKKNKIKTLTEDEFLNLIATRGAKDLDQKYKEKQKEEEKKIKETAKSMVPDTKDYSSSLWTVKYAPRQLKELCGNPGLIERLRLWLEAWPKNAKSNFMKPGKDGSGVFRAAMLSGPPGIGKTTAAHLVAESCGYKVIEMNASDTRNKKLLETMLSSTLDNTVLDGFLQGKVKDSPLDLSDRSCLIMDEVDGTSGGDRGGIGALNALIKKTKVPIICIANDRSLPKMKPLTSTTLDLKFRRPDVNMIRSRLMSIAYKEGIKIDKTVADQLVAGTQSDIRQIINILSTWKLSSNVLTFDETKKLTDARDSNSLATPFALLDKLFGPYAWSATSNARINEKLEVYFQEFDMLPMFVQENYLKHRYSRAGHGPQSEWKRMQLTSQAADAISDGDMVERMLRGSQQWTLMPTHGMLSTVLPAYYCYGTGSMGNWGGGDNCRSFPSWFGKNSTQTRLARALTDIQIHMRLKVSGDKREIRQSYVPNLLHKLTDPLIDDGADGITDVIQSMDDYYLSKDEWDAILELGIGENAGDPILKKIPAATKSALTRKYNASDHPIPFHKATEIAQSRKAPATEKPDLEEAFEVEPEPEGEEDEKKPKKGEVENTIKDKLVKAKKPKATAAKGAAAGKAAPKGKAAAAKPAKKK